METPEPIDQVDSTYNSRLRSDFAGEILRRPVSINRPMDAMLAERLFGPKPATPTPIDVPPALPGVRIHAQGALSLRDAIHAIERTIGYSSVFSPTVDASFPVQLPKQMLSLEQAVAIIEDQSHVVINVFPEGRTILVLPE
jgi:hypothetical protein